MDVIKSISNNNIQEIKRLITDRGYRHEHGLFFIEGHNIVKDCPRDRVVYYCVAESGYNNYADMISDSSYIVIDDRLYGRITDTKSPQSIAAVCSITRPCLCSGKLTVVADNIADPINMATIMRTMAASGATNLLLYGECCDIYSPKVARGSMGGLFYVDCAIMDSVDNLNQYDNVYLLDMAGENIYSRSDRSININSNVAVVVGSESRGISRELYSAKHTILSLPMSGAMESLNAGVSLSIALYELIYGGK